jgi:hypothetical protein
MAILPFPRKPTYPSDKDRKVAPLLYFGKQKKSGKLLILCGLHDQGRLNHVQEAPILVRGASSTSPGVSQNFHIIPGATDG